MSSKENITRTGQSSLHPWIKSEPKEPRISLSTPSTTLQSSSGDVKPIVKPEPTDATSLLSNRVTTSNVAPMTSAPPKALLPKDEDVPMGDADTAEQPEQRKQYTVYQDANDIDYQPETALKEGLAMVKAMKTNIKKLELGSKLRKDVWLREIESLQSQGAPTTMIAVCGATGAGKSSILNAILDACTAVVTEIGYHNKNTIDADVSFLSEHEWREELKVLLDDLVDEDGNIKRSTDLRSDAGVAWSKVHAVYPTITQEQLIRMSVDQILAKDIRIAKILGTTKHISSPDSKTFAKEIGKYIDSKDQKRGDKKKSKDKDKAKEKESKGKSLLAKFAAATTKKKTSDDDPDGPAFWPLIRQVNVHCNAACLSTGAILVDLPGVADANAARNNIAKDYMKKCDCIWILAPITRAVDDKTARDLMGDAFKMQLMNCSSYDDNAITFIASKCDDISCSEVIRALNLDDDPELERIEEEIDSCKVEEEEWKEKKVEAENNARDTDKGLKEIRAMLSEYKDHLNALQNDEPFEPILTGKKKSNKSKKPKSSDDSESNDTSGKKRKRSDSTAEYNTAKKIKTSDEDADEDDDLMDEDYEGELQFSDSETEKDSDKQDDDDKSDSGSDTDKSDDDDDDDDDEEEEEDEEVTEDSLKAKIEEAQNAIKEGRIQLSEFRRLRKEATDMIATIKKKQLKAQREKNAFCSLKRSEFSRDVLKEDFRQGLKDLDDAAAEERDPNSFDPTVNLRDYDAIDLPVFTCSARDYVRLKGQVKGDGDPSCFSKVEDTGVPALQQWCHHLTVSSRERAARNFMTHLMTFVNSVRTYVQGIGDVTESDRITLQDKWESSMPDNGDNDGDDPLGSDAGWASSDVDYPGLNLSGLANQILNNGLYTLPSKAPKVDRFGEPIGITPRLIKDFKKVIGECVKELQTRFRDGLEEKCQVGAENAAAAAVETSDTFAASMHWATYRATLRRHGSWRRDLNVELSSPFTRNIAASWSKVFEADLFATFEKAATDAIKKLVEEVEASAAPGLKERAKGQGELSLEEAKVALTKTIELVRETITTEQKEVSRCLAPHVQGQLIDGYDRAMEERGTGSVARQKALFHNYVGNIKNEVFEGAADVIMGRLSKAAEAVGNALEEALAELAEKVEVSMAVLWEGAHDDPKQVRARFEVINTTTEILNQIQLWTEASQKKKLITAV
ncbi:hypothetical protein C8Q75DRAFT_771545 [Abortiporus biennis]|nr:hypothetical protein C8Q75DRAFT_771545 [Abortiporus biennis]